MPYEHTTALNNRGQWYVATSKFSTREIERRFQAEMVASVLYDRIGAIVPQGKGRKNILIQVALTTDKLVLRDDEPVWTQQPVAVPDWNVMLGLQELGVTLERPTDEPYLLRRLRKT